MPVSLVSGDSLLAVDVGGANTRAVLFDVVEGQYRFIASSISPSTAEAPFKDIGQGVRTAIGALQSVTGRTLIDGNGKLLTPTQPDGSGADMFVATLSAGRALKTVIVGLLSEVSLESARRLAETTYARIVESMGIDDHRQPDQLIDLLVRLQPDLVVITGGTDGGASRSVHKMLEPVGLAAYLLGPDRRPAVLFAGNQKLDDEVKELLGGVTAGLQFSPNVRPSLDTEDLDPAARQLGELFLGIRQRQLKGVELLQAWSNGNVMPTAYAEGRMIRFLGRAYGKEHEGVLGVEIGASGAVVAAGFGEKGALGVYPQFGLGENLPLLLQYTTLEEILKWTPLDISTGVLRDYIFQKSLYPSSIAVTKEDQSLAQAVTRQALHLAMQAARRDFPRSAAAARPGLLPFFNPILAGGGALTNAPTSGQCLLLLLDAIQPVGVATFILDRNNLLPMLGAAASLNSVLPVQMLESGAFQSLGTVISLLGSTNLGGLMARAVLQYADGRETAAEIKYGSLEILPLPAGEVASLSIQPKHGVNVGFGPGRGGTMTVSGGEVGVVFDGRGRPLVLPEDGGRRRDLLKKWSWTVGE